MVIIAANAPNGAAPDSPEVIGASPLTGAANIRIPFAATQSGAAMNTFTWFFKMSQEMVFGSKRFTHNLVLPNWMTSCLAQA